MKQTIARLAREPLFHFLLIGALLFVVFDLRQGAENLPPDRIVIDREQIRQLAARFERTRLRPPTETELKGLIEGQVREEVYYREALAMGLERDDPIVRRRMQTKLEFILDDLFGAEADDEKLRDYLAKHAERYAGEARTSFRQVFLNADKHGDLDSDARRILQQLRQGADENSLGDASLLPASFSLARKSEIERSFGADFGRTVTGLEPGDWTGPVYSPFGAHLVKVEERIEPRAPALEEVYDQVKRDFLAERREQQKQLAYRKLREKYDVIIESIPESANARSNIFPAAKAAEQ